LKKLLLLFLIPFTVYSATENVRINTSTHKVIKPAPSGQALFDLDFSDVTTNISGGGGGGTPGGANQTLQFNNSLTFGGVPYATYDGTAVTLRSGGRLFLADTIDITKKAQFNLALSTTGTTRVVTIAPGADSVTVTPLSASANNFMTGVNVSGVPQFAQPTFTNLSGTLALSQTSMATGKLIGRGTASTGPMEEITLGTNLSFTGTTLNAAGGSGTPGGSNSQLQFNNSGVFGGTTILTTDGTSVFGLTGSKLILQDPTNTGKSAFFDLSGITAGSSKSVTLANGASTTVLPDTGATNNFLTAISAGGAISKSQPLFTNIGGTITMGQNKVLIGKEIWQDGTNGSDITGARGDLTKPFLTIAAALAAASVGDVVYAGPGTTSVAATPLVVPAGVTLVGAGVGYTIVTGTTGTTRGVVEPGTGSAIYNLTMQNTSSTGIAFGVSTGSSAFTSAYVSGCKIIGISNGIYINKTGTTGLAMDNTVVQTQGLCLYSNIVGATSDLRNCDFISDGTGVAASVGISVDKGIVHFYSGTITVGGGSSTNICGVANSVDSTLELHDSRLSTTASGTTNFDVQQVASASLGVNNVYRPDAAVLSISGTITQLSRYALRDNNLSDFPNIGSGTRGDIIYRNATGWTKLAAGTDGNVLTTHSTTGDPSWDVSGSGGVVNDTAFASSWNGVTSIAPSKNTVYDWGHTFDTDDDGKVNVLDQAAGIAITDASGVLQTPVTDNHTNWDTAFTDRLKWDGGATGLTAATGRTSLGATTVGSNIFTLTNPSAISFIKIAADNSVNTRTPTQFKSDLAIAFNDLSGAATNAVTWSAGTGNRDFLVGTDSSFKSTIGVGANATEKMSMSFDGPSGLGEIASFYDMAITSLNDLPIQFNIGPSNGEVIMASDGVTVGTGATTPQGDGTINVSGGYYINDVNILSNTAWASSWNGVTTTAPTKNAIYDWGHAFDANDNGKVDVLDQTAGITVTDGSGVIQAPLTAPSGTIVGTTDTQTLTNKRVTKRALSTNAPGATPTIGTDSYDVVHLTGLGTAVTSMTTNLTGTPVQGDMLKIDFTDDGTGRAITWGASFESSPGATLPTTTVASTRLDTIFAWNSVTSKWRCLATSEPIAGTGTVTSVGLAGTSNQITITGSSPITSSGSWTASIPSSAQLSIAKITNLTSNGFVKTGSADGSLSVDTATYLTSTNVDDTAYASSWNAVTTNAPSKNAVYDWGHTFDTDDDGKVNVLDMGAGVVKSDSGGAVSAATAETDYVTPTGTGTLSGKRITPRAGATTWSCGEASSATSTPTSDSCDQWDVTALAAADAFAAPSGTPVNGQKLIIRIKDNGTARALSFATGSSGQYRFSTDLAAPTTTVISKTLYMGFVYNSADSRWDCVAQLNNF